MRRVAPSALAGAFLAAVLAAGAASANPQHADPSPRPAGKAAPASAARFTPIAATKIANANGPYLGDTAVSSDGRRLYLAADNGLHVLDITKSPARQVGDATGAFGRHLALRPGRTQAYVGNGRSLYVVDVSRDQPRKIASYNNTFGGSVLAMAVSPNGKYLAVGFGGFEDSRLGLRFYSLARPNAPRQIRQIDLTDTAGMVVWNRTGTLVALGLGLTDQMQFVDTRNPAKATRIGRPIGLPGDSAPGAGVFSKDGASIWVVGDSSSVISRVDVAHRSVAHTWSYPATANDGGNGIRLTPDSAYLYVLFTGDSGDATVFVLDRKTMKPVFRATGATYPVGLSMSSHGPTQGRAYLVSEPYTDPGYLFGLRRG